MWITLKVRFGNPILINQMDGLGMKVSYLKLNSEHSRLKYIC